MIQHVYERAREVTGVYDVVVATDDERVAIATRAFGGTAIMTSPDHPSGTDRLVEVMRQIPADVYINVQADEPLVRPEDLSTLLLAMQDEHLPVGTLCHPIDPNEANNPNCVKVVLDNDGYALYFSRSPIPYPRTASAATYLKHIGVYAYQRDMLVRYSQLTPTMLEQAEMLEQLRLMAAGIRLRVLQVAPTGPGVDTPESLERVRAIMAGQPILEKPALSDIRLVITDVDGVLTDGGIYYDANGECQKRFHVRDGLGIRLLEENGVRVAVLSGRDSPTLRKRVADLGVTLVQFGIKDKAIACHALMEQAGVSARQTACIGDDSIDLPAFAVCGLSYAVADAPIYVKRQANGVLTLPGGSGAFRELADAILVAQGKQDVFGTADGFISVMTGIVQ